MSEIPNYMNSYCCPHCYASAKGFEAPVFCPKCGKKYADAFKAKAEETILTKPKFKITVRSENDEAEVDETEEVNPSQFKWTVAAQGGTETDSEGRVRLKKFTIQDWARGAEPPARNPGNVQGDVLREKKEWLQGRKPIDVGGGYQGGEENQE